MKKIFSIFSLRALILACGLFVGAHSAFAVYFEAIEKNKDFYIYNVDAQKYIKNNNGQMTMMPNLSEASTWQFSGTSGSITVKNGNYYILAEGAAGSGWKDSYPGGSATGNVSLVTSQEKMSVAGDKNGYTFSISKKYNYGIGSSYTYYFAYNGSKFLTNQSSTSNQSKWQLVSKRQLDNTITLSASSLALEAIQDGDPATAQFYVNYDGNPTSISLTNGTNTLTISSPVENQHTILVSYQVDASGAQTFTLTDGSNIANEATFSFAAAPSATLNLTVSTTAASGNAIAADEKIMTITGTVVTLKPQYIDWAQDFSALSLTTDPIALNAVAKTTDGATTGKTITYSLSSTGVVKIVNNVLYVLAEGTTTITARVEKDATYVGDSKSLTINVSGVPTSATTITPGNASSTGIYTGTVGGPSLDFDYAFHRAKRQVDLQKCFDNAGQALFDTLYIFGVTSNTDGALVSYTGANGTPYNNVPVVNNPRLVYDADGNYLYTVPFNATTPCYVYAKKKNENTYVHTRTFDATKTRYDWGTKQNGKHIYFTGYCPFAYMGVTPTEEGWMYFMGGNENLDIYLDSCQIMGRYKTQSGLDTGYEQYILKLYADVTTLGGEKPNNSFMSGSSAPFVFTSTTKNEGQSYKPHIHIAGKNHLEGQVGSYITQTLGIVNMYLTTLEMDAGISNIYTYSSPIVIKPTELGQYTDLELTDVWKDNTITNGYLKLNANKGTYASEKVPVVDLGSKYGSLTINGGQYLMRNAAADGNYACNLAVSYRLFSEVVEKSGQKVLLHLYGFGGDMTDAKVTINSGTFMMYKNMYPGEEGYLGEGYYIDQYNFLDLRLPAGNGASRINGGTFNGISNVLMCTKVTSTGASPKNGYGDWLCLQEFEVTEEKQKNGSVNFTFPELYIDGERVYDDPQVVYDITNAADREQVVRGDLYGGQSVNTYVKDGKCYVNLLLAGKAYSKDGYCPDCSEQAEAIIFQWATAIPKFDVSKYVGDNKETMSIGGGVSVIVTPVGEDVQYQTNQLLYMDCAGMEEYSMDLDVQDATLTFSNPDLPRGQIENSNRYTILKHLNILKTVQADTWYTFTAPFNVHDVSVIETDERKIDREDRQRSDALELQAVDNLKVLYDLQHFIIPSPEGRASSMTLSALLNMVLYNDGVDPSRPTNTSPINPLTHYDGTNIKDAHYYLYELDIKDDETEFKTDGTGETLDIKWKPVAKQNSPTDPILEAGKVYAMQFPWCPMCNDLADRTYYDYWSNKMILFHGNGDQTVEGSSAHNTIVSSAMPNAGYATLAGNFTLYDMTLAKETAYVHNMADDYFVLNTANYTVKPTEGFLLYNSGSNPMPARISRTGQIEYDENIETGIDGVPTIADRTSLMILGAYDGFEVLSLCEQLVTVYNLQGNIIFQQYMTAGEQVYVATGAGIYVVRGESEAIKVMVD